MNEQNIQNMRIFHCLDRTFMIHDAAGDYELRWPSRPFPIETPKEIILKDKNCLRLNWSMIQRFTTLKEDGTRNLWLNVKVQRKE